MCRWSGQAIIIHYRISILVGAVVCGSGPEIPSHSTRNRKQQPRTAGAGRVATAARHPKTRLALVLMLIRSVFVVVAVLAVVVAAAAAAVGVVVVVVVVRATRIFDDPSV